MIGAEFKKQIAKSFGQEMRKLGFKGTGLQYFQETEDFLFAVYIELGRWGGHCTAGFAVHPKEIKKDSEGKLNLKKLKIYEYEFKMGLSKHSKEQWWKYTDEEKINHQTLSEILQLIKTKTFPVFDLFRSKPNLLELFKVSDLKDFYKVCKKKAGITIDTTETRFAWALAIYFERKNLSKAKQFAKYGLSDLEEDDTFFGRRDFKRILLR